MPSKPPAKHLTTGRTRRALKVGTLTTQVGGSYLLNALKRPFQSEDRQKQETLDTHLRNALLIVERSKELKGAFMKLLQMLSMRHDLFPPEVLEIFSVTQSQVPPMPYAMIRRQVEKELGKPPEKLFASFEQEAFAAASLGQVHRATLHSGETVAVKIQYPGVDETVGQDLKNVKALLQTFTVIGRDVLRQKIDSDELYRELEERLGEELDYEHEARNLELFRKMFADDDEVVIPSCHTDLTSRRVITLSFVEGYPLSEFLLPHVDQDLKDWVAIKYFRVLWRQIFEFGTLHTDPHPGNFRMTPDGRLCVLDFGAVAHLPDGLPLAMGTLLRLAQSGDADTVLEGLRTEGFVRPHIEIDPEQVLSYLDPFVEPARQETFTFSRDWMRGQFTRLNDIRNPDFTVGLKLNLPPSYALIHRVWLGTIGVLCQLGATVPMRSELEQWAPGFVEIR